MGRVSPLITETYTSGARSYHEALLYHRGKVKMSRVTIITVRITFWNPSILTLKETLEPMESSLIVLYMQRNRGVKPFVLSTA